MSPRMWMPVKKKESVSAFNLLFSVNNFLGAVVVFYFDV